MKISTFANNETIGTFFGQIEKQNAISEQIKAGLAELAGIEIQDDPAAAVAAGNRFAATCAGLGATPDMLNPILLARQLAVSGSFIASAGEAVIRERQEEARQIQAEADRQAEYNAAQRKKADDLRELLATY